MKMKVSHMLYLCVSTNKLPNYSLFLNVYFIPNEKFANAPLRFWINDEQNTFIAARNSILGKSCKNLSKKIISAVDEGEKHMTDVNLLPVSTNKLLGFLH